MLIKKAGGIESILEIMIKHIKNESICGYGCGALKNILEANQATQNYACEKGCVNIILGILKVYRNHLYVCEEGVGTLGIALSSQSTHSRFYKEEVRRVVQDCRDRHKGSVKILHVFMGLTRNADQRVLKAVARSACTKKVLPRCGSGCKYDERGYCSSCCVQQKAYRCLTCDGSKVKLYCETCWKKNHQGHQCEEFFYPTKCGTSDQ